MAPRTCNRSSFIPPFRPKFSMNFRHAGPPKPVFPDQACPSTTEFVTIRVFPVAFPVLPSETARKR
jgi:hypothetical protein